MSISSILYNWFVQIRVQINLIYTLIAFRWFLPKINISLNHENTPPSFFPCYLLVEETGSSVLWNFPHLGFGSIYMVMFTCSSSPAFRSLAVSALMKSGPLWFLAGALCGSWATLTTASHWAARDAWWYLFYSHINNVYVAIMEFLYYLFISQYFPLVLLIFLL